MPTIAILAAVVTAVLLLYLPALAAASGRRVASVERSAAPSDGLAVHARSRIYSGLWLLLCCAGGTLVVGTRYRSRAAEVSGTGDRPAVPGRPGTQLGPARGRSHGSGLVLLPWATALAMLVALVLYGTLAPDSPKRVVPRQGAGLSWGGTALSNERRLRSWLRAHGGPSYLTWKKRHPAAVAVLGAKTRHPARGR